MKIRVKYEVDYKVIRFPFSSLGLTLSLSIATPKETNKQTTTTTIEVVVNEDHRITLCNLGSSDVQSGCV